MDDGQPDVSDPDVIASVAMGAEQAFWASVAEAFPELTTGDFPPDATFRFAEECKQAVRVWVETNV